MNASHGTLISFVELLISQFLEKSSGNQMSSFMRCESATHTDMKCSLLQNQTQTDSKGDTFIHFVQIKVCQKVFPGLRDQYLLQNKYFWHVKSLKITVK